jgi:23S rRNA (guanosine2251-2'-O)-methyltransferase
MQRHKPKRMRRPPNRDGREGRAPHRHAPDRVLLYGLHAVEAALANKGRPITRLRATENAARRLEGALRARGVEAEPATPRELDRLLGADTVHQGVVLETEPLHPTTLDAVKPAGILIVLDQVTDPHNVGAVLRSAAAFGAAGVVLPERHSPPLSGALAKAASGALDLVPVILVKNLARALAELGERGFTRVGLAEDAPRALAQTPLPVPLALVFGAEGKGLRQLTRESCDTLCRIDTKGPLASLNVSNAAAIALHWASATARANAPSR